MAAAASSHKTRRPRSCGTRIARIRRVCWPIFYGSARSGTRLYLPRCQADILYDQTLSGGISPMEIRFAALRNFPGHALAFSRTTRARRIFWWIFGIVAAIGVLGALVAPPIARFKLEQELTKVLHRKVTIETIRINPYTL